MPFTRVNEDECKPELKTRPTAVQLLCTQQGNPQHTLQILLVVFDVQLLQKHEAAKYLQPTGHLTSHSLILAAHRSLTISPHAIFAQCDGVITCPRVSGPQSNVHSSLPGKQTDRSIEYGVLNLCLSVNVRANVKVSS